MAGFLKVRKRHLTVSSVLLTTSFIGLHTMPATAAPAEEQIIAATNPQTLEVADALQVDDVERADYSVTEFDIVQWPLGANAEVSGGFGWRDAPCRGCSTNHTGVDWTPGAGTPISIIADGVVRSVSSVNYGYGVHAIVDHVIDGRKVSSLYAHMQFGSLAVAPGQRVKAGQIVGSVGNTGMSTGAHLHFEILLDGVTPVDPLPWLRANVRNG